MSMMPERITLLSGTAECEDALFGVISQFDDVAEFNVYVAGPPNFVQAARTILSKAGLGARQIKTHTDWIDILE